MPQLIARSDGEKCMSRENRAAGNWLAPFALFQRMRPVPGFKGKCTRNPSAPLTPCPGR